MAPDSWKDDLAVGFRQFTTAARSGHAPPEGALEAYNKYRAIKEKAPNLIRDVTDDTTKAFYDMADVANQNGYRNPQDALNVAAGYMTNRDAQKEEATKRQIVEKLQGMDPNVFRRAFNWATGKDSLENRQQIYDMVAQSASMYVNALQMPPDKAIEFAMKGVQDKFAVVNGWAIPTNDRRLGPDFEKRAEKYLDKVFHEYGQLIGAKDRRDLSLVPMGPDSFQVINKRKGYMAPLEALPDHVRILTPEKLEEIGQELKMQDFKRVERDSKNRLEPLFVVPGTSLGMSRPSLKGYTPEEVKQIQKNIDRRSQAGSAAIADRVKQNAETAKQRQDEVTREERNFVPTQKNLRDSLNNQ
jgi:hypothetical protein